MTRQIETIFLTWSGIFFVLSVFFLAAENEILEETVDA